jgi:LEA14-like dessication related protein
VKVHQRLFDPLVEQTLALNGNALVEHAVDAVRSVGCHAASNLAWWKQIERSERARVHLHVVVEVVFADLEVLFVVRIAEKLLENEK